MTVFSNRYRVPAAAAEGVAVSGIMTPSQHDRVLLKTRHLSADSE